MLIQTTIKTAICLAIGLGLAACATADDPASPMTHPANPTASPSFTASRPPTLLPPTTLPPTPLPPSPTVVPAATLPDLGPAPDFTNEVWLNTEHPIDLASLEGQVVLVEFWTYG